MTHTSSRTRRAALFNRSRSLCLERLEQRTLLAAVITVNSADDTDTRDTVLTLREALEINNRTLAVAALTAAEQAQLNGTPTSADADTIQFNIPGSGVHTISPESALPPITDSMTIDGYTQPGASANTLAVGNNAVLLIELDGTSAPGAAFIVNSTNNTFKGLVINRFAVNAAFNPGYAFRLLAAGNTIQGNFLGTNPAGDTALLNNAGISVEAGGSNLIGGPSAAARNLILGGNYSSAIDINTGDGNTIQGNYIGTNAAGSAKLGRPGIQILTKDNQIGGTTAAARNVMLSDGGFSLSLHESNATGNKIQGNYIGINATGDASLGGNTGGINLLRAPSNTIGGDVAGAGNVISGNGSSGITAGDSDNLLIQGNLIGTNAAGTAAVPNGFTGITIDGGVNSTIGGTTPGARNIISGNGPGNGNDHGIRFSLHAATAGNLIQGNYIGTDITGTVAMGNGGSGLQIFAFEPPAAANAITIGGTTPAARNLISANSFIGIDLDSPNILVQGNYIGTDVNGTGNLGNTQAGIEVFGSNTTIGGAAPGAGNIIAFNGIAPGRFDSSGIVVAGSTATGNTILGNSIFSNAALGINLSGGTEDASLVTANDTGDADTGPNNLQNFPVLTSAITTAGVTTITGTLNSTPTSTFRIELFSNAAADPSGNGEGQTFLGATDVTTDASGNASISFSPATAVATGLFISSTATNTQTGDTSEFSADVCSADQFTVTNTDDSGAGSLRQAILNANAHANSLNTGGVPDLISFCILGSGLHTISPLTVLPTITDPVTIDGYTQPGSSANTLVVGDNAVLDIELNGTAVSGDGLTVGAAGAGSTIQGLVINRFVGNGVVLSSGNNLVAGNFIGVDPTGTIEEGNPFSSGVRVTTGGNNVIGGTTSAARNVISGNGNASFGSAQILLVIPNAGDTAPTGTLIRGNYIGTTASGTVAIHPQAFLNNPGILIESGTGTIIGGADADDGTVDGNVGARNVISGNAEGIDIAGVQATPANGNTIAGNFIGVDATGIAALPNFGTGITVINPQFVSLLRIGGTAPGAGNVISGNGNGGFTGGALSMVMEGNFIGTDLTATRDLGNNSNGIEIALGGSGSPDFQITIGGTTAAARNIISGNTGNGISTSGLTSGLITIEGNFIGTQGDGQTALQNNLDGVHLNRSAIIGSAGIGGGNVIAHNGGIGVDVLDGSSTILGNSIFLNGGLGIDLGGNGPTPNDTLDPDTGPNNLQNFPVITSVTSAGGNTTIQGTLNSLADTAFRIELFVNAAADPSGFGEGQAILDATGMTTDANGNGTFSLTFPTVTGTVFTATATRTDGHGGNIETSEFSAAFTPQSAAPTVTINQATTQADPTSASPIQFTVAFSTPVTGFTATDVSFAGSTVGGTLVAGVSGSGANYTVSVTGMSGSGTVVASILAGAAVDTNNTPSAASTSADNVVTFQAVALTVTINQAASQADPTNVSPIHFTVVFSAPVTDFATGDVTLSGTAGATTAVVTGSGTTYDVAASGMTASGTVIATIGAGQAHDSAASPNTASTSTDNTVLFDNTSPTVTINQAAGQPDPTNTQPINFTVVFSEPVGDFATGDVTLSGTAGAATATVTGSGTTYNVTVTGMTSDGTVIATIAAGKAHDAAGNASAASTSTDNVVIFDISVPRVTINQALAQADPTGISPIHFTVVFSEPVSDFATGDVTLSGTAGPTTAIVTGSGTTYDVAVSGMTHDGTVTATLADSVAHDASGNASAASTSTDNTVTFATQTDMSVQKTGANEVAAGQNLTYTIVVTNGGPITAQNVTLTDTIPANTTFVSAAQAAGSTFTLIKPPVGGTGNLMATIGSFASGASGTFRLVVHVNSSAPVGDEIENTARVATTTTDSNPLNDISSTSADIEAAPLGLPECNIATLNAPAAAGSVVLQDDADNPGQNVLLVTGTSRNDVIVIEPRPSDSAQIRVKINGHLVGIFQSSDVQRIVAYGLNGNDTIVVNATLGQSATLFGGNGNDYLFGGVGNDQISGGSGNDHLFGLAGDDTLCGDDGNDFLYGGLGNDTLFGEAGTDRLFGESGNDVLIAGAGNDFVYGGSGDDQLFGQGGIDLLFGETGNDIVAGGDGNDKLFGGTGRDLLIGGTGADQLFGEAHDDILIAGSTTFDESQDALSAILTEWTSANNYATRINNLRSGGGASAGFALDATTVVDDFAADTLWGQAGQDWFLVGLRGRIRDRSAGEQVN